MADEIPTATIEQVSVPLPHVDLRQTVYKLTPRKWTGTELEFQHAIATAVKRAHGENKIDPDVILALAANVLGRAYAMLANNQINQGYAKAVIGTNFLAGTMQAEGEAVAAAAKAAADKLAAEKAAAEAAGKPVPTPPPPNLGNVKTGMGALIAAMKAAAEQAKRDAEAAAKAKTTQPGQAKK